jgi:hypothetical protein
MSGHTPGPWVADIRGGCLAVYQPHRVDETRGLHEYDERNIHFSDKGAKYNQVLGYWEMDEEAISNARLIAAAPEMLELLKKMQAATLDIQLAFLLQDADKLIAKAEARP